MIKKEISLYPYMDAWNDDELSDGAWMAMLEEGVVSFNKENNTNYDFYDELGGYIEWRNREIKNNENNNY